MALPRLSPQQTELVLRRAAEIEARRDLQRDAGEWQQEIGVEDLVRLGKEAGLGTEAILRAWGEVAHGQPGAGEPAGLTRALGPGRLLVSRELACPAPTVQRAVERFLRDQLMTIRRHHGERIEWERAQGLWPGLARSLDFARRYAFGPVSRVETTVIPQGDERALVTFEIDLSEMRRYRLARLALRATAAFALIGVGGAALFPGFGAPDVAAVVSGGAIAGGFAALERRRFQQMSERVALAPERFLDLLVQRRKRGHETAGI